jgi:hypothetical protein
MPQVLWTKNILESQGYKVKKAQAVRELVTSTFDTILLLTELVGVRCTLNAAQQKNCCRLLLLLSHIKVQLQTLTKRTSFDT